MTSLPSGVHFCTGKKKTIPYLFFPYRLLHPRECTNYYMCKIKSLFFTSQNPAQSRDEIRSPKTHRSTQGTVTVYMCQNSGCSVCATLVDYLHTSNLFFIKISLTIIQISLSNSHTVRFIPIYPHTLGFLAEKALSPSAFRDEPLISFSQNAQRDEEPILHENRGDLLIRGCGHGDWRASLTCK